MSLREGRQILSRIESATTMDSLSRSFDAYAMPCLMAPGIDFTDIRPLALRCRFRPSRRRISPCRPRACRTRRGPRCPGSPPCGAGRRHPGLARHGHVIDGEHDLIRDARCVIGPVVAVLQFPPDHEALDFPALVLAALSPSRRGCRRAGPNASVWSITSSRSCEMNMTVSPPPRCGP